LTHLIKKKPTAYLAKLRSLEFDLLVPKIIPENTEMELSGTYGRLKIVRLPACQ